VKRAVKSVASLATSILLAGAAQAADPGYYVIVPYDREGILSAEVRYWTFKPSGRTEYVWPEVGVGYGFNSRWTSLLLGSWVGSAHDAVVPSNVSWQNEFMLTQGEYPFDLALHGSLIRQYGDYSPGEAYEFGPIFQTEFGPTQVNLNVLFDRERSKGAWGPTMMKYQWQVRQHGYPWVQFGVQGFGEVGPWSDWASRDGQSHRAGPAIFATLPPGGQRAPSLQAAWLVGKTYGQSGHMFSMTMRVGF
jgi:hypothetical protein